MPTIYCSILYLEDRRAGRASPAAPAAVGQPSTLASSLITIITTTPEGKMGEDPHGPKGAYGLTEALHPTPIPSPLAGGGEGLLEGGGN